MMEQKKGKYLLVLTISNAVLVVLAIVLFLMMLVAYEFSLPIALALLIIGGLNAYQFSQNIKTLNNKNL